MPTFTLTGVPPYDGSYEIPAVFSNKENHRIKQISGARAGEVPDALAAGDTDVVVALTIVVLERQGLVVNEDLLWEANLVDNWEFKPDEAATEDADRPPATATTGGSAKAPGVAENGNASESSSGRSGTVAGENNPPTPSPTGSPGSETFADFDPVTSET